MKRKLRKNVKPNRPHRAPRVKSAKKSSTQDPRDRKDLAVAQIKELELQQKQGELIKVADVLGIIDKHLQAHRTVLLALPRRVATILHDGQTPAERETAVTKIVREALSEISAIPESLRIHAESAPDVRA